MARGDPKIWNRGLSGTSNQDIIVRPDTTYLIKEIKVKTNESPDDINIYLYDADGNEKHSPKMLSSDTVREMNTLIDQQTGFEIEYRPDPNYGDGGFYHISAVEY